MVTVKEDACESKSREKLCALSISALTNVETH